MPGVNGATQIVTNNNGTFHLLNIGPWFNELMQNPPAPVEHPDAATERIPIESLNLTILATDRTGTVDYTPIKAVKAITVANLATPVDLRSVSFETGSTRVVAGDTSILTRYNNKIIGQSASSFVIGHQMLRGLRRHILTGAPPNLLVKEVQLPTVDSQPVPHVVTVNWGEQNFTRADCLNFLDILAQDPTLDQADVAPLSDVINENTYYDIITDIVPGSADKLYDLETATGIYQLYSGLNIGQIPSA